MGRRAPRRRGPPEKLRGKFEEAIKRLPSDLREVLFLRYAEEMRREEVAEVLGESAETASEKERKALKQLADELKRSPSTLRSWLAWWGSKKRQEFEALAQSAPPCPSPERIYMGLLRGEWTEEERQHLSSCPLCQSMLRKLSKAIWHPSLELLRGYAEDWLSSEERAKVEFHLLREQCPQCNFLVSIFKPRAFYFEDLAFGAVLLPRPREKKAPKPPKDLAALWQMLCKGLEKEKEVEMFELPEPLTECFSPMRLEPPLEVSVPSPNVAMTQTPVPLGVESPLGPSSEVVEVSSGDGGLKARLALEEEGWTAYAEVLRPPQGAVVLFFLVSSRSRDVWRGCAFLRHHHDEWHIASIYVAPPDEALGECYFGALLIPPQDFTDEIISCLKKSLPACLKVDPSAKKTWRGMIRKALDEVPPSLLEPLRELSKSLRD